MNRRKEIYSASGEHARPFALLKAVLILFLVHSGLLAPTLSRAQEAGTINLGVQVGQPGGGTVKVYRSTHTVYTGLFTTAGGSRAALYVHRLREQPLPDSLLRGYLGGGLLVGGERLDRTPEMTLGITAQLGLNFYSNRFEVFLHATPIVQVLPRLRTTLGGSVGLRYMLRRP